MTLIKNVLNSSLYALSDYPLKNVAILEHTDIRAVHLVFIPKLGAAVGLADIVGAQNVLLGRDVGWWNAISWLVNMLKAGRSVSGL